MSLCPPKNSPDRDIVYTPRRLAKRIVKHFSPQGKILDPCRGKGAFYDVLPNKVYWCELSRGRDFYDFHKRMDWIIGNPPWSEFVPFLEHAMEISNNIVFLITLNHVTTRKRLRLIKQAGWGHVEWVLVPTPKRKTWPQSGFQLCAFYIQRGYKGKLTITDKTELWQ